MIISLVPNFQNKNNIFIYILILKFILVGYTLALYQAHFLLKLGYLVYKSSYFMRTMQISLFGQWFLENLKCLIYIAELFTSYQPLPVSQNGNREDPRCESRNPMVASNNLIGVSIEKL